MSARTEQGSPRSFVVGSAEGVLFTDGTVVVRHLGKNRTFARIDQVPVAYGSAIDWNARRE